MEEQLTCEDYRRFGVEIELNTPSGKAGSLPKDVAPEGAEHVAHVVHEVTKEAVHIFGYHNTHNNNCWVVKPDSSCGIEVCSPIFRGWDDQKKLLKVIDAFRADNIIKADERCSLHVHIDVADLLDSEINSVLTQWIKCEPVFMDMAPTRRKKNRYCQLIGLSSGFDHNNMFSVDMLYSILSMKYYSVNTYHLMKNNRRTIEFRTGENDMCLDAFAVKNWIRLILHFVNRTSKMRLPRSYIPGDPFSGYLWLDPKDVFEVLGFNKPLSPGLQQVKKWMLGRMSVHGTGSTLPGVWSDTARKVAYSQIEELLLKENQPKGLYDPDGDHLYGKQFSI